VLDGCFCGILAFGAIWCETKTAPVTSTSSSADYSAHAEISAADQKINNCISKTYRWSSYCFIHFHQVGRSAATRKFETRIDTQRG
jgi:hypothetical protein